MANTQASKFGRGYNSFSGVDIKAVFSNQVLSELQAISYSITREKAPLYTLGSADPRSFSRGKRGIAGTLIFLVFDRHALLSTFGAYADSTNQLLFLSDIDDIKPAADVTKDLNSIGLDGSAGRSDAAAASGTSAASDYAAIETNISGGAVDSDQEAAAPWFIDQLPPIDITLAAANEHGSLAVMSIFGVEMLNEGCGVSIDDIVTEQQVTYVARTLLPWQPVGNVSETKLLSSATGG